MMGLWFSVSNHLKSDDAPVLDVENVATVYSTRQSGSRAKVDKKDGD